MFQATWLMAVAVVLSEGGNQAEEISGGAAIIVTPLIPFRMAQAWQLFIWSKLNFIDDFDKELIWIIQQLQAN